MAEYGKITITVDTGVLPLDTCPANVAPYVPGQLGINSFLVNAHVAASETWTDKTSAEIAADIQKAVDFYKEKPVPKKTFGSKPLDPDNPLGVAAHQVFTSSLIHTPEQAQEGGHAVIPGYSWQNSWDHDWDKPVGTATLSNHASGLAMDFVLPKGTDHMHFDLGGGPVDTAEPEPELARVWCMYHDLHFLDPVHQALAQNTFECGSGTWTRDSTPLEDKQVLAKIQAMQQSGLL